MKSMISKISDERAGELSIGFASLLWGLFPVITVLSYNKLSPLLSLSISSLVAGLFFGLVITLKNKWPDVFKRSALVNILLATLFTGVLYYCFVFFSLRYTTSGNVSIISLSEVFFSYLFFHILKKEYISRNHLLGSILVVLGALIVLYPNLHGFHKGDFLILVASMIAPFGNFFARKARKEVGSEIIMFVRSILAGLFIFALYIIFDNNILYIDIKSSTLFLLTNGLLLLGFSKILWIEGIHRIAVTKANAISSLSPLITLFVAWIVLKQVPTLWQLTAIVPMFFGVRLLSKM